MAVSLVTGFTQIASKNGRIVTILGGDAVISGSVVRFATGDMSLPANALSYIYLNFTSGNIEQSTSGFLAGAWPICTVQTDNVRVTTISDLRPDVFGGGGTSAGAVLLAPSADQHIVGANAVILDAGSGLRFPTSAVATTEGGSYFAISSGTTPFNGVTDNLFNMGYNCLAGNSPIDPTKPMFAWQVEIDFFDGVDHWNEWHYDFLPVGGSFVRPFILSWKNNDPTYWGVAFDIGTSGTSVFNVTANRSATPLFSINGVAFQFQNGLPLVGLNASAVQKWAVNSSSGDAAFNGSLQGGTAGVSSALSFSGLSTQGPNLFTLSTELGTVFAIAPNGAIDLHSDFNFGNNTAIFNAAQLIRISGNLVALNGNNGQVTWSATGHAYDAADTGISRVGVATVAIGNGSSAGDFSGSLKLGKVTLASAAPTVAAAQVGLGSTTAATATAGGGQAALATVLGYLIANVAGTTVKIPYFAN